MEITDPLIWNTEACMFGELWTWGDMKEDGMNKFVCESENCENGMGQIKIRPKEVTRELVLRLFWGAGDRSMVGRRFLPRFCVSLVKNVEIFLRATIV